MSKTKVRDFSRNIWQIIDWAGSIGCVICCSSFAQALTGHRFDVMDWDKSDRQLQSWGLSHAAAQAVWTWRSHSLHKRQLGDAISCNSYMQCSLMTQDDARRHVGVCIVCQTKWSCDASHAGQRRCMTHTVVELVSLTRTVDACPGFYLRRAARPFFRKGEPSPEYTSHPKPPHRCDLS